jgi:hypothetical protein
MCNTFHIDDKNIDRCRLDVLQNNLTQFNYSQQLRTLELHLGYDLGKIPMLPSCLLLQIWYM